MSKFQIRKSPLYWLSAGIITLTVLGTSAAKAVQIVFDGGSPDLRSANEASAWTQANNFWLAAAQTITGVNFWSIETPQGWGGNPNYGWDGNIRYYIFEDAGGRPSTNPYIQGNATNIVRNATGRSYVGSYLQLDEYAYSFDFSSPIQIAGNTTYWLGLHLASDYNSGYVADRNNVYWVTTGNNWGGNGMESYNGTFNNWTDTGTRHAFQLTSRSESVPEPLTILGTIAAVGFGVALRRKYQNHPSN